MRIISKLFVVLAALAVASVSFGGWPSCAYNDAENPGYTDGNPAGVIWDSPVDESASWTYAGGVWYWDGYYEGVTFDTNVYDGLGDGETASFGNTDICAQQCLTSCSQNLDQCGGINVGDMENCLRCCNANPSLAGQKWSGGPSYEIGPFYTGDNCEDGPYYGVFVEAVYPAYCN